MPIRINGELLDEAAWEESKPLVKELMRRHDKEIEKMV